MLSLARAVSLAEIVLARLAAACWERPDLTVFTQGKTWPRQWEIDFYRTCLRTKFDSNGRGFETLRRLRDLYMHGYGVPVREADLHTLAASLHREFEPSKLTAEEAELGYEGVASFFGPHAIYDAETGVRDQLLFGLPAANITPLACFRALERIRSHICEAAEAVLNGTRDDVASSRFVKKVERWWEQRGGYVE